MLRIKNGFCFATLLALVGGGSTSAAEVPTMRMVDTSMAGMQALNWMPKAPGVWSAAIGKPELGPMEFAGQPMLDALKELGEAAIPAGMSEARGNVVGGYASVRLPLDAQEHVYGLGMRSDGDINLRSKSFRLQVTPSSHAPIPFYISSAGYGIVINTARIINLQIGTANRKDSPKHPRELDRNTDTTWSSRPQSDAVEANAVGTGMEILLLAGKTPLDVVRRYNLYCGGGCLPPRWSLGFWHRVAGSSTADEVVAEVAEFATRDMPVDVIGLEPGWQSAAYPCTYEWDPQRFPDPSRFMEEMSSRGISINLWENMFVSKKAPIFKSLEPYTGSHTYWLGQVPDYTIKAARDILTEQHRRRHLDLGVSGYKIDEVDELSTEHMLFPSGLCGEQMRQIHGLIMQKTYLEMFRNVSRRTCGLVRGSNAGGSPYPFALYTDEYDHRGFIQALTNSSLAGVLWCSEVRSASDDEDWIRRFQTALFSPVMQLNGWANGAKPWSREGSVDAVRELLKVRTRLIPYLYTCMADYRRFGIPPFRHMILEDGFTPQTKVIQGKLDDQNNPYAESKRIETSDQYMFGPCILVAPMVAGEKSRKVILPRGKWFDFHTGKLAGEDTTITVSTQIDQVPLFVKDGGIVPLMPAVNNVRMAKGPTPLEVRHYGTMESTYQLYDDDGETFDYERGVSCRQELRVRRHEGVLKGEAGAPVGPWNSRYSEFNWTFMSQ